MEEISGVLSLSLSKRSRGGEERKGNEGGGGCFHSRGGVLFFYDILRFRAWEGFYRLREKRYIRIYVCSVSSDFQSCLKLCFRDQVTFHSTDDSL